LYETVAIPTFHKGIVTNDWKKIDIDDPLILESDVEVIAITPQSLDCIYTPADVPL
jgi:hypothetical protein